MSDLAKKAREAMKAKAKRLGSDRPLQKVDSSTFVPPELLNADVKTGLRPISRRAYKSGGKVEGACGPMRADRKARKNGGEATSYANAKINRNVKEANELREGKKHIGGMKKGGRAGKQMGGGMGDDSMPMGAGSGMRTNRPENVSRPSYNEQSVDAAIASSNRAGRKISGKGASMIKSLLKGRSGKEHGGGLYEGNKPVVSPTAPRAKPEPKSSAPQNAPLPPRRPADLPRDEGMTAAEAEKFMKSRKAGGRAKKAIGGAFGQYLSPALMVANALRGERDKDERKSGGRAKKQMGGPMAAGNAILQGSAAASGVPQDRLGFAPAMPSQGVKKFLGLKKGGKAEHPDEAMDKALIKKMVKAEARTGKMKGGETFSGKSYPGKVPGVVAGGRMARKDGGRAKKGKTNINIVIQAGKPETAGMDVMNPMLKQPAPPPMAPPIMPPPGAPPTGGPPPGMPPMPPGGAPGMPPMMGRKTGGRVSKEASSYKDMTAGAGSGEGRLQKTDIAKRSNRRAGGKVYRSYKDMDAGAGSGLGRLEKTEIQARK